MLDTSNDILALHANNGFPSSDARQIRVSTKAFPVASAGRDATHVGHGTEGDVDAFSAVFCAHGDASLIDEVLVKGGGDIDSGGAGMGMRGGFRQSKKSSQGGNKIGKSDAQWGILHAKADEAQSGDILRACQYEHGYEQKSMYTSLPNTATAEVNTGGEVDLFFQRELVHERACFRYGTGPVGISSDRLRRENLSKVLGFLFWFSWTHDFGYPLLKARWGCIWDAGDDVCSDAS